MLHKNRWTFFSASDLPGIDADNSITDLDAHTASGRGTALDDYTASEYRAASDDIDGPYDSDLEISETQFGESDNDEETNVETGEMSEDANHRLGVATQITERRGQRSVLAFGRCRSVALDLFHLR